MDWIYLASAIFGGSFLIPMVLGGLASDADFDTDFDTDTGADFDAGGDLALEAGSVDVSGDVDLDGGTDFDVDHGHHIGDSIGSGFSAADAIVGSLLSFRSVVFFAAFFGVTGLLLGFLGYSFLVTLITALVLGAVAAVTNSAVFGLLKASESSSQVSERSFLGRRGVVTVPVNGSQRGRIRIDLGDQPQYLVAAALSDDDSFEAGHPVTVVQLENSIALVVSLKKELDALDGELGGELDGHRAQLPPSVSPASSPANPQTEIESQDPEQSQKEEG